MVKRLSKACHGYESWKRKNNPSIKPWLYPEQMVTPRLNLSQCVQNKLSTSNESLDESGLDEKSFNGAEFDDV